MTCTICGASGNIGSLVVQDLMDRLGPANLVLVSRAPHRLAEFEKRGAKVVFGDYNDRASLDLAFEDGTALLLVSGPDIRNRVAQHRTVIEAAKAAGIGHITYTSVGGAHPNNPTPSTMEHVETERMLWASGLSFAALRPQMHSELLLGWAADQARISGKVFQVGNGWLSPISRSDIAACIAAIMSAPQDHDRVSYELTGPERMRFHEVAQMVSQILKMPIDYIPVSADEMYEIYDQIGAPRIGDPSQPHPLHQMGSDELVNQFLAYEQGYLDMLSGHVAFLTGRAPRPLKDILIQQAAQLASA